MHKSVAERSGSVKKFLSVVGLGLALCSAAQARTLYWQGFDTLAEGDRELGEAALAEEFGADTNQWPDWITPMALYAPTGHVDFVFIVRRPVHEPCGQYKYTIYGTVTPDLRRDKWGEFCAGAVTPVFVPGRDLPDLFFEYGYQEDSTGVWQRADQKLRWDQGQWWLIKS